MSYIYLADVWCDDCGRAICRRLKREGNAPADPDDEWTFDSDEYPKAQATMTNRIPRNTVPPGKSV